MMPDSWNDPLETIRLSDSELRTVANALENWLYEMEAILARHEGETDWTGKFETGSSPDLEATYAGVALMKIQGAQRRRGKA